MNCKRYKQKTGVVLIMCLIMPHVTQARMYGQCAHFKVTDLPQKTTLRKHIERLPNAERKHAMRRLHSFSFPEKDLNSIQLDKRGDVYYRDAKIPQPITSSPAAPSDIIALPTVDAFKLHSHLEAKNTVFLDFDGHNVVGTSWNDTEPSYSAVAFDIDDNPTDFNADERSRIAEVWHRIAEDYAPFDIDVTTEMPENFGPTVGHVVFTKDTDANNLPMPSKGSGGISYVNVFGLQDYATAYSPSFIYYNNLGPGYAPYMAEAGAHEFGHNLGLSHDGMTNGTYNANCPGSIEYYCGVGNNYVSWGPIMGVSYYSHITEWSKGEYPNANNTQDDLSIIASKLQYRKDDNSDVFVGAKQLMVEPDGNIFVTNPENDPANTDTANKGVIETARDVDTFWFTASAGDISLVVEPAWVAFKRDTLRGANLDIEAKLYDQSGVLIASNNQLDDTSAIITTTLNGGRYYLTVTGVGNNLTPYSDYASLGEYFISGHIAAPAADVTAPSPMDWAIAPAAQSRSRIAMTATTAVDNSGAIEYQFQCVAGGQNCTDSAWQSSPSFVATGLATATSYSFRVIARDVFGNISLPSAVVSAITNSNQIPVTVNDSATLNEDTSVTIAVLSNDTEPDGEPLTISAIGAAKHGSVVNKNGLLTYKPVANYNGRDSFVYTVTDGSGGMAVANVAITINPLNDVPSLKKDIARVFINKTINFKPLVNDTDVDRDILTLSAVTAPKKGKMIKLGNTLRYTAGKTASVDTLTYTVSDGHGGVAKSVITITILK